MNIKYVSIGIIFILISIWFYAALSSFKEIPGSYPASIIVRDGIERSAKDVAIKLADDIGFDLEGAYKSGYNHNDVVDYLISQPHSLNITIYEGKYYEGRMTVLHIIPFSVCSVLFVTGIAIIIFKGRKK